MTLLFKEFLVFKTHSYIIGTLRNGDGSKVKNMISRLVFAFLIIDKFSLSTFLEILEQQKVKGSASKANKDC